MTPRMIVLHFTGGTSLQSAWTYFDRLHAEPSRKRLVRAGAVNVSAHFLVDQDGTIYRLLPETTMARHVIGLNHVAIGVENVGNGKSTPLTEAQVLANARWFVTSRHVIRSRMVIGHHEADRMRSHPDYKTTRVSQRPQRPEISSWPACGRSSRSCARGSAGHTVSEASSTMYPDLGAQNLEQTSERNMRLRRLIPIVTAFVGSKPLHQSPARTLFHIA